MKRGGPVGRAADYWHNADEDDYEQYSASVTTDVNIAQQNSIINFTDESREAMREVVRVKHPNARVNFSDVNSLVA